MSIYSLVPFWKRTSQFSKKNSLLSLHNEVNQLFEDFFKDSLSSVEGDEFLIPSINIVEQDKQYEITVELPGVEEKDVEVSVINNELLVNGSRKIEKKEEKENYHLRECAQGSFNRSITLPYDADVKAITAKMKNGVLKIDIGKTSENLEKIKKIPVIKETLR